MKNKKAEDKIRQKAEWLKGGGWKKSLVSIFNTVEEKEKFQ